MANYMNIFCTNICNLEAQFTITKNSVVIHCEIINTVNGKIRSPEKGYIDCVDLKNHYGLLEKQIESLQDLYNFKIKSIKSADLVDGYNLRFFDSYKKPAFKTIEDCNRFIEFLDSLKTFDKLKE